MILKERKKPTAFLMIIIALFISVILINNLRASSKSIFNTFSPSHLGLSSEQQFERQCEQGCIGLIARIFRYKMSELTKPNLLPTLKFHIKFSDEKKIKINRAESLEYGILQPPVEVKARVQFGAQYYRATVRLKGELPDHWSRPKRISLRVRLKGGNTILGMSSFSIHKPSARQHPYDQTFQDLARISGILSARHDYANISVNGDDWGVMNLESLPTHEFLETLGRKESLVFKIASSDFVRYKMQVKHPFPGYLEQNSMLSPKVFRAGKLLKEDKYRKQYSYVVSKLINNETLDLFDEGSMMKAVLLAYLWGDNHTLYPENCRYYLNPYTLKLEPILSDQASPLLVEKYGLRYPYPQAFRSFLLYNNTYQKIRKQYPNIRRGLSKLDGIFANYREIFPVDVGHSINVVGTNSWRVGQHVVSDIKALLRNMPLDEAPAYDRKLTRKDAQSLPRHIASWHYTDGRLRFINLLNLPVVVEQVYLDGEEVLANPLTVPSSGKTYGVNTILKPELNGILDGRVQVKTSVLGSERMRFAPPSLLPAEKLSNPFEPRIPDSNSLPEFIEKSGSAYLIREGKVRIEQPLVLDRPLTIEAGAELKFSRNSYLIINGGLNSIGTPEKPIIYSSDDDVWRGILVIGDGESKSRLEHSNFSRISYLVDGALELTGGLTFYKSDLEMNGVRIHDSHGEDALNIVHSEFIISNSYVSKTVSDGIDFDFSNGEIRNLQVEAVGGDGLDFSGSAVRLEGFSATGVKDKAISVGERSDLKARRVLIREAGVGIASKDGSAFAGIEIEISPTRLSPVMAYQKKSFYGGARVDLIQSELSEGGIALVEKGSAITINGVAVGPTEFDVERLYEGEVMGK